MKEIKKGFTLVELMIVVVILAILSTVGFISYENYLTDTRDSKRLAQLTGLRDALRLNITKWKLPYPDENVEIRNNGNVFLYQWYAWANVLESIAYSDNTVDPLDDIWYTYLLSNNRKDFQLLGFLENYNTDVLSSVIWKSYASEDYSQRFPNTTWKKLGIVLEQETNTPLQEMLEYKTSGYMDLQDTTTNIFNAYITDTYIISWKEKDLVGIIPYTTCKKLLENGWSYWNGIYNINPTWLSPFEVYCNMEIDWGWWTLVGRSVAWTTIWDFWWLVSSWNIRDDTNIYSLWEDIKSLNFSELMLTSYSSEKSIEYAMKLNVDKNFIKTLADYNSNQDTSNCKELFPISTSWRSPCDADGVDGKIWDRNFAAKWWYFENDSGVVTENFYFRHYSDNYSLQGLLKDGYVWAYSGNESTLWEFDGKQWMIFVR